MADCRKRNVRILAAALSVWAAGLLNGLPESRPAKDYPITPVPFTAVRVSDGFWAPRIETNRTVTIPALFKKNEETGRMDNFSIAGGLMIGKYKGERYNDTDVYKTVEGASYSLMVHPDPDLDKYLDGVIAKIAAAQEPDGYLFTPRTASPDKVQPGIGSERWSELAVSHELYNAGHLYEAAAAHFLATGKRSLLDVALKNADLLAATFGPGKRRGFPGHQEVEIGLAKLYRVTGRRAYLDLAKYFLDERGPGLKLTQYPPGTRFSIYNEPEQIQAHKPVLEQDEAVGHAVRLAYMASGMADVAALTGDTAYVGAVERLWSNVVGKKMYITGGIGSRHDRERFGENYELPNLTGYLETCASIGTAFWNQRMFLLTGDARYVDVMERVIYNGVISGVSLGGDAFFYANPLQSDGKFKFNQGQVVREPFFETACCPGNISRFIPSFPGYIYASRKGDLYINLFVTGEAKVDLGGKPGLVRQETRYPWDGAVKIVIEPESPARFTVFVRIPGWAREEAVPGSLYRFLNPSEETATLRVNGAEVGTPLDRGFVPLTRIWKRGDTIELFLPMPIRRVVAHEAVKDDTGRVALERGPLVYCAEGVDNGGRVLDLALPDETGLKAQWRGDLLNGLMAITGSAWSAGTDSEGRAFRRAKPFLAVPYYAWAHRGPGEMAVWLVRSPEGQDFSAKNK